MVFIRMERVTLRTGFFNATNLERSEPDTLHLYLMLAHSELDRSVQRELLRAPNWGSSPDGILEKFRAESHEHYRTTSNSAHFALSSEVRRELSVAETVFALSNSAGHIVVEYRTE